VVLSEFDPWNILKFRSLRLSDGEMNGNRLCLNKVRLGGGRGRGLGEGFRGAGGLGAAHWGVIWASLVLLICFSPVESELEACQDICDGRTNMRLKSA
jgi:hypothetical protein